MTVPNTPDYVPTNYQDGQSPALSAANLDHEETATDTVTADLRTVESLLTSGLPIANGGTGATTAAGARANLSVQQSLTLTTTGTSGAATLSGGTLNIPQYSGATAGVSSFNTRTGAVSLTKADVTGTGLAASDISAAPVASPTFTGTVTLPGDPSSALQAATKQYVDNAQPVHSVVASDITVTNSASVVNALTQAVGTSQVWTMEGVLHFSATTTGDIKFVISVPTGATVTGSVSGPQVAAAGDGTLRQTAVNNSNLSIGFGGIDTSGNNTGTLSAVRVAFRVATTTTAGTVALQFAQNTAEASSCVCKAGSWMTADRMS